MNDSKGAELVARLRHHVTGAIERGEAQAIVEVTAKPAALEWSALWAAMKAAPGQWIETTEAMSWHMLEVLPPRAGGWGRFLVGEPATHNAAGEPVYTCFRKVGARYEARDMTVREFNAMREAQPCAA